MTTTDPSAQALDQPLDQPAGNAPPGDSPPEAPPGFTTTHTPTSQVLVPDAFTTWGVTQQTGYLAQRHLNAAEARTASFAYACVTDVDDGDPARDPWHAAAATLGATLALTRHAATKLIATAVELIERLPRTHALLVAGWIGLAAAHTIAEETALVSDEHIADLDTLIAQKLGPTRRRTHPPRPGPLRKMLTRAVNACDPVAADARAEQARRDTDVELIPLRDDCAQVTATLTAEDALELTDRIDALARTSDPDDPRTPGQRRAAGLLALSRGWACLPTVDGEHPTDPGARDAARRIVIHAYDDGSAGERGLTLSGYGPVTAHTAGQLAATAAHRRHDVSTFADPESEAARRYAPSDALARFCRGRDGTCVFPGCQTPAHATDLDHIIPFDHSDPGAGGRTTSEDLGSLCRTHHRLKTDGVWAYYRNPDGTYTWIHGPEHPAGDPSTSITTEPTGPLADHAAPLHPDTTRRQREAAEAGRTGGNGSAQRGRRPHLRDRRAAEHRRLRDRARQRRRNGDVRAPDHRTTDDRVPPTYEEPPF